MTDLAALITRDHADFERSLDSMMAVDPATPSWRDSLDAARLGFVAHAEAEVRILQVAVQDCLRADMLRRLVKNVSTAHRHQERLLVALQHEAIDKKYVLQLLAQSRAHDNEQRWVILPTLKEQLPEVAYAELARSYALERLRAIGTLAERFDLR